MKRLPDKWTKGINIAGNIITFGFCVAFSYFFGKASYAGFGGAMPSQLFWWTGFVTGIMACCAYWMLYMWIYEFVKRWRSKRHNLKTDTIN